MGLGTSHKAIVKITALTVCALLASCRTATAPNAWSYHTGSGTMTAEDLLDSDGGPYTMVEQNEASPIDLHDQAKKAQDPHDMNGMVHRGVDYDVAANRDDSYQHIVRLVRNGDAPPPQDVAAMMPAKTDLIIDSGMAPPMPEHKPDIPAQEIAQADVPMPLEKPDFENAHTSKHQAEAVSNVEPAAADAGSADMVEVSALRFGTHPDKVRMVFDVSGPVAFDHQLNNRDHMLSIEIPDAEWATGKDSEKLKSPLIQDYKAMRDGHNVKLDITLKKPVKVVWAASLKPDGGKGNRLVLDLAAL